MNLNLSKYNGKEGLVSYANRSSEKKAKKQLDAVHHAFYNTAIWKRMRAQCLRSSPLCVRCEVRGRTREATTVDHVVLFQDRHDTMATDSSNLRGLCLRCHGLASNIEKSMRLEWRKRYDEGESIESIAEEKYAKAKDVVDADGYYV